MSQVLCYQTIGQLLEEAARTWPDHEALVFPMLGPEPGPEARYTWASLDAEVNRLARGLMAMGVERGDRVALWATNRPQWLTMLYATAKIGAVLVTVNTHYRQAEIEYLLRQSEANYLVLMESFRGCQYLQAIYNIVPELAEHGRDGLRSEALPHLRKVIFLGREARPGLYLYQEVLDRAQETPPAALEARKNSLDPDDIINMQYTSGTTGFPKGVMLSHRSLVTNGHWAGRNQHLSPRDRICLPVPLFHCFGLVLGALAAASHGATLVVLDIYSAFDILVNVERERCTAIYGVPTVFISLLEQKGFEKFDLSALRTGIMAGAPCPVKTMVEVIEKMKAREITIGYGLTETSPLLTQTLVSDSLAKRTETVGRPIPGVELRVVDPRSGAELPAGQVGEVLARGYVLMKGYYNLPEATAQVIDRDGWFHTGDLGRLDEDGYLAITGRQKDMVIRAGENIYPQEVEEYLRHMPGVSDVQVVAVPSALHGEELGAFLLARPGYEHLGPKEVKAYLRRLISGYKIPRYVKVLSEFPLTASGKIQKFKLREMAIELWPQG